MIVEERELVRKLLEIWKELRDVRKHQNYSVTNHKLIIHKEAVNHNQDLKVCFSIKVSTLILIERNLYCSKNFIQNV